MLPNGLFKVILADPPWRFENYSNSWHEEHPESRWVGNQYSLMTTSDIAALPVAEACDKDCVLFLWATGPRLPDALEVLRAWGFTYKTLGFTWVKTTKAGVPATGMGKWTRSNAELVLLGTKGHPKRIDAGVPQIVLAPRAGHSVKPEEVQDRIERLVEGPYLELFARRQRPGWTCWGNEL